MKLQEYLIHLKTGDVLHIWDNVNKPYRFSIENELLNSGQHGFFKITSLDNGKKYYIPRGGIDYIVTGDIKLFGTFSFSF